MTVPATPDAERRAAGLCAECLNARRVLSARGSAFWLCALAARDSRFPRYPTLPVLRCPGHAPTAPRER